jgi:TRAP-type C4-dicarboxylate transport system permease small subunit
MARFAERFGGLVQATDRLAQAAVACLIGFMVAIVFAQVIFRYVLVQPIYWGDELARYLFVWISFLGAGVAMGQQLHYGFDYVTDKSPPRVRRAIALVMAMLAAAFLLLCFVLGIVGLQVVAAQRSPSLQISMGWVYAALPAGGVLLLLHLIEQTVNPRHREAQPPHPE